MTPSELVRYRRFVALGDSQTEGVGDEPHADGAERGWADRFAERLASVSPGLTYANLAVRGRRIAEVEREQLPAALALKPDLASVIAGINDLIRPRFDLVAATALMDGMHRALVERGGTVVTCTFPDLSRFSPAARLIRARLGRFNAGLRTVAERRGALLVDLERWPGAGDARLWQVDRLHLNAQGHEQLAAAIAAAVIGSTAPPASAESPARRLNLLAEARWVRSYLMPWIGRRLLGQSSGDGRSAKRPQLAPVSGRCAERASLRR